MQNKKKSAPLLLSPIERENYDLLKSFLNSLIIQESKGNQITLKNSSYIHDNQENDKKQNLNDIYQTLKRNNQLYQMLNAKEGRCRLVEEKTKEFIWNLIRKLYEQEKNGKEVLLVIIVLHILSTCTIVKIFFSLSL